MSGVKLMVDSMLDNGRARGPTENLTIIQNWKGGNNTIAAFSTIRAK